MSDQAKLKPAFSPSLDIACEQLKKRDAALLVANGNHHIHSSPHGTKDLCYLTTREILSSGQQRRTQYPWELVGDSTQTFLRSSQDRHQIINKILEHTRAESKRHLRDAVTSILEELLTNAIYHPYQQGAELPKYQRKQRVTLSKEEMIRVTYGGNSSGVYLDVSDQGGALKFEDIARCFKRCYEAGANQIETKESGAGLGLYFVFDSSTHMKVEVKSNRTSISCWISDKRNFDPLVFSFNYFDWR